MMKHEYVKPAIKVKELNADRDLLATSGVSISIKSESGSFGENNTINAKPYEGWNDNSQPSSGIVWDDEE